ncbi:dimethylaniline monooxygenase [N-oxide-forming] 2-like [Pleurodeles waltl]|uniref:dimethylaniline monooxygenase [N-oxide-forming] 2-like n=1 Tax=Pleurodeles waltl TaxID=8319 RepID=UPI003709B174
MMCYSDFLVPDDFPNYLHNSKVLEYYKLYAVHFGLMKHIKLKVFLSSKRGAWVFSRIVNGGYPFDMWFLTRFKTWIRLLLPNPVVWWLMVRHLNQHFDHSNYGLQRDRYSWKEPLINEDLPHCIIRGSVVVKPSVVKFTDSSVIFDDGTSEDIEVIIFATGFDFTFPFLDESVMKPSNSKVLLYKHVFPPDLEKPTLAFIGIIQPIGAVIIASEMQARWATRVFKGLNELPSLEKQGEELAERTKLVKKRFGRLQGNTLQIELIEYVDAIASEIGVKPNFFRIFLTDPRLAMEVVFRTCTSSQYRLIGPGKWDGARNAILTKKDRVLKPMKTRVVKNKFRKSLLSTMLGLLCLFALFASVLMRVYFG